MAEEEKGIGGLDVLNGLGQAEKAAGLIARLLKDGGRVLVVGGETGSLPKPYQEDPRIIIWDDNLQGLLQKEIPSNVKVIMYSRWVSHTLVNRLNNAAKQLHALKFPMLKPREIKILLSEIVQADPVEVPPQEVEKLVEEEIHVEEAQEQQEVEQPMAKKKSGRKPGLLKEFVAKHLDINKDFTVKGSIVREGERLFAMSEKTDLKTTLGSMTQAISITLKELGRSGSRGKSSSSRPSAERPASQGQDDFAQLDILIADAIAAMKLVQEHLPKVRKETERLRGMRDKVMKIFS